MGSRASVQVPGQDAQEDAPWLQGEEELKAYLEANDVSTERFGKGSAKTVANLLFELRSQACFLEPQPPESEGPKVLRIVEPVFIRLCWRSHVLVQEEQQLTDGRMRNRKMLLAEKKEPCDGGGLFATIVRALQEELGLDQESLQKDGALVYRADAYHFELEQIESPSYPGLASMYRTHHVMVDIPDESLELFRCCGLPDCRDFVTLETSELGTTTHYWKWYDTAEALLQNVVKFPPQVLSSSTLLPDAGASAAPSAESCSWRTVPKEELPGEEELVALLTKSGIDPARYGQGKAKTVKALLTELRKGDSYLEWHEQQASLRRIAEPVFIQFRFGDRVLVEVEQQFTNDGRIRKRNMLLAEKKAPEDADVCATALRGLREELDLPEDFPALEDTVHFMQEAYCCMAEHMESGSYPGLSCVYVTHYCVVQIKDAGLPCFKGHGMLENEFETKESDKVNRWRWTLVEDARKDKVKGFPELKEQKSTGDQTTFAYEPLTSVRLDAASLRVLLEVGGVNVSAWGEYAPASLKSLARELETGAAQLERDRTTGKIRRVLKSNLVQVMVEDKESAGGLQSEGLRSCSSAEVDAAPPSSGPGAFGMDEARNLILFRADLACFEVVHADTASYPGLPCCHQTRLVQFDQRNSTSPVKAPLAAGGAPSPSSAPFKSERSSASGVSLPHVGSNASMSSDASEAVSAGKEPTSYPRLLDDVFAQRHAAEEAEKLALPMPSGGQQGRRNSNGRSRFRNVSILSRDDGFPGEQGRNSAISVSPLSRQSVQSRDTLQGDVSPATPKRRSLYRQLRNLQKHLRFRMVAGQAGEAAAPPAEHAVACSCDIQLIRNINPLNATFHCRFAVYLEWIDAKAVGLPLGEVAQDKIKELGVPEIALQNTLATSLEIHSKPEVVDSGTGHVACKVLFQALMQMELNMRLFPFDEQRLVLVLGLRARRDRSRALFCQFCSVDRQIKLDEWRLTSSFLYADRPDGRARVQFGVVISRAYWHYVVNVLVIFGLIATLSLVGYLLLRDPPFDRLRFGVAVLFAQTTFRLSIENKLPKVSYSTAFDKYAIFCQLLVLAIMVGNATVSMTWAPGLAETIDSVLACTLAVVWLLGNFVIAHIVWRARRLQHQALEQLSDQSASAATASAETKEEVAQEALEELEQLKAKLHFSGSSGGQSASPGEAQSSVRAVSVAARVWLLHDIDPVSATFECKFTIYLEWLNEAAVGLPEGEALTEQQLALMDPPEVDVHNKVELSAEKACAYVVKSSCGQLMLCYTYHARLQIHLNLRRFPFDCQRLPIHLRMPNQKDQDRAFIFRSCHLAQTARSLDEWFVDGLNPSTDYTEGLAQATLEVCIRRRSGYYVVSILSVLMGISVLMFTVFVIDVEAEGGFTDQGKILVPLMMTLLSFKLLISAGKIPKASYATIFDKFMLLCESLFFLTTTTCSVAKILAMNPGTFGSASAFITHAALVVLTVWAILTGVLVLDVRCGREGGGSITARPTLHRSVTPTFEEQRKSLTSQPLLAGLTEAPMSASSEGVLLRIKIKQIHSVNATNGCFVCEFVASMAWLVEEAKELMEGELLGEEKLKELRLPALRVQNALTSKQTVLDGGVVCSETGHLSCQVLVRAQIQLRFQLEDFPFDRQSLAVVLSLPEPRDLHRHLVLEGCENQDAVKVSEWAMLGTFAGAGRHDGTAQAVFGVTIRRHSHYYVTSLRSLCLWSFFIFPLYTINYQDFANRGKILTCNLLVSIVCKLAVSSKLPRISCFTVYDRVALSSLAMVFGVGISAAFWCLVGKLEGSVLSSNAIQLLDWACGVIILLVWVLTNARVAYRLRRPPSGAKQLAAPDEVPVNVAQVSAFELPSATTRKELDLLRQPPQPFGEFGQGDLSQAIQVTPRGVRKDTAPPNHAALAISVGVKLWMVCNVDASSATFECKFHVFLEWFAPSAVGMPTSMRISSRDGGSQAAALMHVDRPRLAVKNAITVLLEDCSDLEVRNSETGHVSCHIQYHVRVHHRFNLRCFPFDSQRLELDLELQNCRERCLTVNFCDADDQTTHLDGWKLTALSTHQDELGSRRLAVLMLVERESQYYVRQVIAYFFFLTTLLLTFFMMRPHEFAKRQVDVLKIVLTQTTFRFSVEHRLPKVQHQTPFDTYVLACQALILLVVICFITSAIAVMDESQTCAVMEREQYILAALIALWLWWNVGYALHAQRVKRREAGAWAPGDALLATRLSTLSNATRSSVASSTASGVEERRNSCGRDSIVSTLSSGGGVRPWELGTPDDLSPCEISPQVVSVAFRIWLVRNIDLVTATFECKFRVFLEWLDEDAKGLPKGKKAKLPVPELTITNSVQSQVLDKSSAPEVVNSDTGHLAVQILYRATLRMDQEVHQFPFDCQWLAITLSLRDEGAERSKSFMFQYCEVDNQLKLDEWTVHPKPGFSTLTKHEAPSIQDTVMCGIIIKRSSRYYVVNIMGVLFLISSLVFTIYTIDVTDFWERAEVFLGVFPVTVVFKMSAQAKLPRVGYSTKFDLYASSCQNLFVAIVLGCMLASLTLNLPRWWSACGVSEDYDEAMVELVQTAEKYFLLGLLVLWVTWNVYFAIQAWRVTRQPVLVALRGHHAQIKLQDDEQVKKSGVTEEPDVSGLALRLSRQATYERMMEPEVGENSNTAA